LVPGQGFSAGETSKTVVVQVKGDLLNEPDETFLLQLSHAGNGLIACAQAVGTIVNDDAAPALAIGNVSVMEGNSGTTSAELTVSLSAASGRTVTVNYATANGTATAGSDYLAANGTLTFLPGQTNKTISVAVLGDLLNEPDETFLVQLGGGSDWTTVTNAPVVSGDGYRVTLAAASGSEFYRLVPGQGFSAGETSKTVIVLVKGDLLNEPDETFLLQLSNATNAVIACAQ